VQFGDDKQKILVGTPEGIQVKRREYRGELGALVLSLINPDMWDRFASTKSTQNPAAPHLLFFHLHSGPTCQELSLPLLFRPTSTRFIWVKRRVQSPSQFFLPLSRSLSDN
jgi:hypothetical protein